MAFLNREVRTDLVLREQNTIICPGHIHDEIELLYVLDGGGTAICDGKTYHLQSGDYFLVFPNQSHFFPEGTAGKYILLLVKPSSLRYHQDVFLSGYPLSALYHDDGQLLKILQTALEEQLNAPGSTAVHGYLCVLFDKLLSHYKIENSRFSQDRMLEILEYCARHYREELSLGSICREFNVSRSHISHTFSSRVGMSFPDYVNSLRLNDAANLLKEQNYSITAISNIAGFPTIRTFNRVFMNWFGITPSQYRKILQEKEN